MAALKFEETLTLAFVSGAEDMTERATQILRDHYDELVCDGNVVDDDGDLQQPSADALWTFVSRNGKLMLVACDAILEDDGDESVGVPSYYWVPGDKELGVWEVR